MKRSKASKLVKVGAEQEEFAVQAQPIPVQIHRTKRERMIEAATLVTISVVASVVANVIVVLFVI